MEAFPGAADVDAGYDEGSAQWKSPLLAWRFVQVDVKRRHLVPDSPVN
jgi:hypothetical protein